MFEMFAIFAKKMHFYKTLKAKKNFKKRRNAKMNLISI